MKKRNQVTAKAALVVIAFSMLLPFPGCGKVGAKAGPNIIKEIFKKKSPKPTSKLQKPAKIPLDPLWIKATTNSFLQAKQAADSCETRSYAVHRAVENVSSEKHRQILARKLQLVEQKRLQLNQELDQEPDEQTTPDSTYDVYTEKFIEFHRYYDEIEALAKQYG